MKVTPQQLLNSLKKESETELYEKIQIFSQFQYQLSRENLKTLHKTFKETFTYILNNLQETIPVIHRDTLLYDIEKRISYGEDYITSTRAFLHSLLTLKELYWIDMKQPSLIVYKMKNYIQGHFQETLTLKDVAKKLDLNYNYISNIFNQELGMGFNEYLNNLRLEKSLELLKSTNMEIGFIALEVGFSSQSYFSKTFKNHMGLSPQSFRKSLLND